MQEAASLGRNGQSFFARSHQSASLVCFSQTRVQTVTRTAAIQNVRRPSVLLPRPVALPPARTPVQPRQQVAQEDLAVEAQQLGQQGPALSSAGAGGSKLRELPGLKNFFPDLKIMCLYLTAIICVEFGVETLLDHYLGDSPVGSVGCMVVGAGIMLGIRFRNLNVASGLLQAFYSKQIL